VEGLAELMRLNQAVGILIEMGYTPEQAHVELGRVADNGQVSIDHLAQQLIRATAAASKRPNGNSDLS